MVYNRSFIAAENSRLYNWQSASDRTADGDVKNALVQLRRRSRELVQNEPLAKRYISLMSTQILGRQGIKLQWNIQGLLMYRIPQLIATTHTPATLQWRLNQKEIGPSRYVYGSIKSRCPYRCLSAITNHSNQYQMVTMNFRREPLQSHTPQYLVAIGSKP